MEVLGWLLAAAVAVHHRGWTALCLVCWWYWCVCLVCCGGTTVCVCVCKACRNACIGKCWSHDLFF
jgi:hypothetical protein